MTGRDRFLAACRGAPVDATPVWFMRQAGGRLPRYLELRGEHSVMDIARTPELCAEVSAGAATALGTDAAVMFADVMLPVVAMGVELELTADGPVVLSPVRDRADVERLRPVDPETDLGFVLEAIALVRRELGDSAAVIGVAGGPFTLAAYLVEGGPSRDKLAARAWMHHDPKRWAALLDALIETTIDYVVAQVGAGADAIQVFDSWAGVLGPDDYDRFVAPWSRRILAAIERSGAVSIHFAAAGAALVDQLAAGATVLGVDSGQSLAGVRGRLGAQPVQGNLDPGRVAAGWPSTSEGIDAVLAANAGRPGHILNTGHAVPRETDPGRLRDIVRAVHDRTADQGATVTTGAFS